ncbi:MAG: prolipoprotein diacylglyceryl transferase [Cyclobacteriaceae bacterium]
MSLLSFIIWSQDPVIFEIPLSFIGLEDRPIVWYGLLFALGFIIAQQVMYYVFREEGEPEKDIDTLTTYLVIAVIVGARLGHCLFYNPVHYLSNPLEILKVWEGGLASHGGAIGMFIAIWLYSNYDIRVKTLFGLIPYQLKTKKQKRPKQTYIWMLDRLAIVTVLVGALIRTGNFMNSEMEGTKTNSDYGIIYARGTKEVLKYNPEKVEEVSFVKGGQAKSDEPGLIPILATVKFKRGIDFEQERAYFDGRITYALHNFSEVVQHIDFGSDVKKIEYDVRKEGVHTYVDISALGITRHPAQLYEAGACIVIMIIVFWLWKNKRSVMPQGVNFGIFMMLLWSERFVDEFFKMNQEAFEEGMVLNMGQILSIPMFLAGAAVVVWAYQTKSKI